MQKEHGCEGCKHDNKREDEYPCNRCKYNADDMYEPVQKQTRGDKIRAMSDEELAESNICYIDSLAILDGLRYKGLDGKYHKTAKEAYKANLKWLQEVEEKTFSHIDN